MLFFHVKTWPLAWHSQDPSGTTPRKDILGSAVLSCPADPPSGHSPREGRAVPGLCRCSDMGSQCIPFTRCLTSLHPSFHTCKMGRTPTSHNTVNKNQATLAELSRKVPAFKISAQELVPTAFGPPEDQSGVGHFQT